MHKSDSPNVKVRIIQQDDLAAIIEIDQKVSGVERTEYYTFKIARALSDTEQIVTSLVAEIEGKVVGFLMGQVRSGEFGIPESYATVDSIGINPNFQRLGIGRLLVDEFLTIMRGLDVKYIQTLIYWNAWDLIKFFSESGFQPSNMIHIERKL